MVFQKHCDDTVKCMPDCKEGLLFPHAGARTVVHPRACIIAEAGPIVIGESNLIEEQVLIINK